MLAATNNRFFKVAAVASLILVVYLFVSSRDPPSSPPEPFVPQFDTNINDNGNNDNEPESEVDRAPVKPKGGSHGTSVKKGEIPFVDITLADKGFNLDVRPPFLSLFLFRNLVLLLLFKFFRKLTKEGEGAQFFSFS